jgi:preprotein translocase subunit YajC
VTYAFLDLMSSADGKLPPWTLPVQLLLIGGIFYFLLIRPQGAARKKHADLLAALKVGDNVMTAGGILGKVKEIKEAKDKTEWRVTIESGTSTLVVERSRIIRVGDVAAPQA